LRRQPLFKIFKFHFSGYTRPIAHMKSEQVVIAGKKVNGRGASDIKNDFRMNVKRYLEDYILNSTRQTGGRTITETDIVMHAGQTGDFFPHHMDAEWCKTQPFGQRIAHGTLIFSIAVGMTAQEINEVAMTYGYERLRFIKPVFIGDTLRVNVTVTAVKEHKKSGYGLVTELVEAFNQRNELVMLCEHLLLAQKKNG
jgi:acyl dehydratase